jgi:hypothetical protein
VVKDVNLMEVTKSKAIRGLESITQKKKQKFSVNVVVFKELSNSSLRFKGIEIAVPLKELQWQFLHCCVCCN